MALSEVLDAALPGTCFSSFVFTLYWSVVDYQSCVSFRCLAMWLSFTHTRHDQQVSFPPEPGFLSLFLDKPDWSSWSRAPPTPQGSPCPSSPGSTPPPIHPQQAPASSSSSEKRKHQAQRRKKTKNKGRERDRERGREGVKEGGLRKEMKITSLFPEDQAVILVLHFTYLFQEHSVPLPFSSSTHSSACCN